YSDEITDGVHYYRIRVVNEGDINIRENDVSSFSYPPKKLCELGRANRKGQQVLYTSVDPHTAFFEKASEININSSIVYLSKWKIKRLPKTFYYRNFF